MKIFFDHEKLAAYQQAIDFLRWSEPILERTPRTTAVHGQLDRARTSIPLNLAEGNGKFTVPDKCKYFGNAHGSALECASCLDVLFVKDLLTEPDLEAGKTILCNIVRLVIGLIKSKQPERFVMREEGGEYRVEEKGEGELE